ncbi:MAG: helix-turn-helix domain-containing protein [Nitriliruptorales bacterium]|jgi:DNA-binding CsgD family transcriptional regulator
MDATGDIDGHVLAQLTVREREVLRRTALGQTNAQVAAGLGVTVHAVKFHLHSIFRKLSVRNRTEAAAVYLQGIAGLSP